ncbi:MAG: DNA-binding response regulator [Gammaproteobacteria bacterium]|nr:MAG: DNA-binding response regulator [Gammaproteobacteria bacterium]
MINVIVVEDQALVRGAISALLSLANNITVVGEAENGKEALTLIEQHAVNIVLTDIEMPIMTGIELVEILASTQPQIKTMIMTTFARAGYIKRAINAGVKGFILKESPSDYLIGAINKVAQGGKVIASELALCALDDNDPLSAKERKALKLAGEGLRTADIAKQLFLSEGTVRNYLSDAIAKLNAANSIDAARIAHQKGWL